MKFGKPMRDQILNELDAQARNQHDREWYESFENYEWYHQVSDQMWDQVWSQTWKMWYQVLNQTRKYKS